jgi:hypothetical protein
MPEAASGDEREVQHHGGAAEHATARHAVAKAQTGERVEGPGAGFIPRSGVIVLTVFVILAALLVLYSLWSYWPATPPSGEEPADPQTVNFFAWKPAVNREELFFLVVALGGALGGFVHTLRSLSWYVGNRRLRWSWLPFNLTLPVVGALAGTVFYVVLRAGLFSSSTSVDAASPFGFTAVALLAGLFSEQAMEKLRQLAAEIFAEPPQGEDSVPSEETA